MTEALTLELTATYLGLRDIGPWLARVFDELGWTDSPSLAPIELAVHELATNIVDHAAPADQRILLEASEEGGALTVKLVDSGKAFEHDDYVAPDPTEPQERGYGLMIAETLASQLGYQRIEHQNLWQATFPIEPAPTCEPTN